MLQDSYVFHQVNRIILIALAVTITALFKAHAQNHLSSMSVNPEEVEELEFFMFSVPWRGRTPSLFKLSATAGPERFTAEEDGRLEVWERGG